MALSVWIGTAVGAAIIIAVYAASAFWAQRTRSDAPFDPAGKHCYVTGGSSGLGKALAIQLVQQGAHVTIVARRKDMLDATQKELMQAKRDKGQKIFALQADVTKPADVQRALNASKDHMGMLPEYVFTCAGASKPGYFLEQSLEDHVTGMDLNYFGTLYTVHAAAKRMMDAGTRGRLILVGSTLSLLGMVGYSQYCPSKYALRGLAECLRQELLPHGITVHIYYVSTIETPGFATESETKPEVTKLIEGTETSDTSPEARAASLLQGLKRDEFAITSDFFTDVFRASGSGAAPRNGAILDGVKSMIGYMILPPWRMYSDYLVKCDAHKVEKDK